MHYTIIYRDSNGSIVLDTTQSRIRIFTYDLLDEWQREHSFQEWHAGTYEGGLLEDHEVHKISKLVNDCIDKEYDESSIELHGYGTESINIIADDQVVHSSRWMRSKPSKMKQKRNEHMVIKLAGYIKGLRVTGQDVNNV